MPLATLLTPLGRLLRGRRADQSLSVRHDPGLAGHGIELSSPAFGPGEIPDRHCSMDLGPNVSPALRWTGVPSGTVALLLVIEDIDVPTRRPALHTLALLPPAWQGLPDGALRRDNPEIRFLATAYGRKGYLGPRPLPGHGAHRYGFHLYALDTAVDRLDAARGHVLAAGFLEGIRTG